MPGRLMCVVAHPDDECFAFGGALLLAKEAGWQTYVLCLTDGQAATNRGTSADAADLGRMRREEFLRSCTVLGVDHHELLSYQDGRLEFEPLHGPAGDVVQRIRAWQPQVVLTFGLDGSLNVHPDHTAVSAFTSAAFHWSGRASRFPEFGAPYLPQRLYHQSTAFTMADRAPLLPAPWTVELDISHVKPLKEAAFREHTSQLAVLGKVQPYWDQYGNREHYTLVGASSPQPAGLATSLTDGVVLE